MTTKTLTNGLLSLTTAAVLALTSVPGAAAAPASQDNQPSVASTTVDSTTAAADYWTPERMKAAVPGHVLAVRAVERSRGAAGGTAAAGTTTVNGATGTGITANGTTAKAVEKGTNTKLEGKAPRNKPALHASENPIPHIGKVFFTLGGQNYVCSGNSVASGNESTVATAGHCLHEGPGAFATNFVFVPAYFNGAAPYGMWAARSLHTTTAWSANGDIQYDTGFAVVAPLNGQTLADTVGASGVQFNAARGLTYKAYGYPAASPFDGQSLKSCAGTATNDTVNPGGTTQGIPCDMTGGSSGGPWFIGTNSAGYQNSVNSYGYGSSSTTMYGPYWGTSIQQVHADAAGA